MKISNTFYAKNTEAWHAWLEQNYQTEKEIWLIFYKAQTCQPCIDYESSVEEALCFGWVDSIIQKIDDEKYVRKYTPRINTTNWSDKNKRRVAKLIRQGRMTGAGLAKIDDLAAMMEHQPAPKPKEIIIPPQVEQILREHAQAWENFCNMAPSYRKIYIGWITSAKREETVNKRLAEAIVRLEQNLPLGMK
jgi:uncharacterized protein YdeI (YjbR/CyaY-like superfamily)